MHQQPDLKRAGPRFEVWAQLCLCDSDADVIRDLLMHQVGIKRKALVQRMHITVYHARRPMWRLESADEPATLVIPTEDTRFMVMAPGGENPRPGLEPAKCKVGIRIQKKNIARPEILRLREKLLIHETPEVLGSRRRSTHTSNAFGARHFQPHMAVLRPGNGIDRDLTKLGVLFRNEIKSLTFDRFCIELVRRDASGNRILT
jgi:hypothetical protein